MANFIKYKDENQRNKDKSGRSNYRAGHNPSVSSKGKKEVSRFESNIEKYVEFISWCRFYPDLFLDLIKPKTGGINLHTDQRTFMRIAIRFLSMYGVYPRGWGKCIAGDSILFTDDGMKEIGEYFDYMESDGDVYVPTNARMLNRNGELEQSVMGVSSGFRDTKAIKTEEGYELQASLKHPVLVMNKNGEIEWRKAEDVEYGEYLLINRNNNVWGSKTAIDINMDEFMDGLDIKSSCKIKKCFTPTELTEEMALILGYLVGDGTMTQDNFVIFTSKDEDILQNYKAFVEDVIGLKLRKKTDIDYAVNGKYFREYLRQVGLKKVDAFGKEIPKCIMEAPKEIVAAFVRGLFDTDGGISSSHLEFCTASEKMSKQLQTVLLNFGIVSTRKIKYNKKYKTNAYILKIYSKNIDLYLKEIGFSCGRKQDKLLEICKVKRNPNKDIIPYQKDRVSAYCNDAKDYNKGICDKAYHVIKGNNELTYEKLDMLLKAKGSDVFEGYDELKGLYDKNYFYSKVNSIESGEEYVYDLSLLDTHSFISNGFVSHNTFNEVVIMYVTCVLYPGIEFSLTAQTKENAAELLKDKHNDIMKKYPWFKNEVYDNRFSKNDAEVIFANNSRIDVLANSQSSKGQRRHQIMIEESALLDDFTFQDALYPIVEHGRMTVGKLGINNPEELSQKVSFFTTAGFRGSDEFERSMRMKDDMANLEGKIVIGSDWHLGCWYGRGSTKKQIMGKKKDMTPIAFAQNYESKWVGAAGDALVDIGKVLKLRTLKNPEIAGDGESEYYVSMDVARSNNSANNQSAVSVLKVERNKKTDKVVKIKLVNLIYISSFLNFTAQAMELKKIRKAYNANIAIVDVNGLGSGMKDELLKEHIDSATGEVYPCWDTINTEDRPDNPGNSEACLYALTSSGCNHEVIVNFMDMVESEKLELLIKHKDTYSIDNKKYINDVVRPMMQTDFLIEELSNLKLQHLNNGKFTVKQLTKRVDKDRYSALAYGLYYIMKYRDEAIETSDDNDPLVFF